MLQKLVSYFIAYNLQSCCVDLPLYHVHARAQGTVKLSNIENIHKYPVHTRGKYIVYTEGKLNKENDESKYAMLAKKIIIKIRTINR